VDLGAGGLATLFNENLTAVATLAANRLGLDGRDAVALQLPDLYDDSAQPPYLLGECGAVFYCGFGIPGISKPRRSSEEAMANSHAGFRHCGASMRISVDGVTPAVYLSGGANGATVEDRQRDQGDDLRELLPVLDRHRAVCDSDCHRRTF